jgi:hypothetical protein
VLESRPSDSSSSESFQGQAGDDNSPFRIDLDPDHVRNVGVDGFDACNLEFRQLEGRSILRRDALDRRAQKEKRKKFQADVQIMRAHHDHI